LSTVPEIHERMRKAALDAYLEEYRQLKETWRSIEAKAQGSIAVAGIFIAGGLAFLTKLETSLGRADKLLLFIGLACLIGSVILAILALRTHVTTVPPLGNVVGEYALGMVHVQVEADLELHTAAYFTDVVGRWQNIINEVTKTNETKAQTLWYAQLFLIFAIIAVAGLTLFKLIR
jgi:hypothetical protein